MYTDFFSSHKTKNFLPFILSSARVPTLSRTLTNTHPKHHVERPSARVLLIRKENKRSFTWKAPHRLRLPWQRRRVCRDRERRTPLADCASRRISRTWASSWGCWRAKTSGWCWRYSPQFRTCSPPPEALRHHLRLHRHRHRHLLLLRCRRRRRLLLVLRRRRPRARCARWKR